MATHVAIITGAAQGIGRAIALRLADDGLDIALNDIKSQSEKLYVVAEEVRKRGRRALVAFADVSDEKEVKYMVAHVVEQLGGIDVMVANAGIAFLGSILETTVEDWDSIMSVNARGVFLLYKHAGEQMIKQGRGGRIIGACSISGKKGLPNLGAYAASKFAVRGITQTAAQEFGKYGITVNAYAPSWIKSEIVTASPDGEQGQSAAVAKAGLPSDTPMGSPEDVASLVSYLVKPEGHFITGQAITLDGGLGFMD